MRAKDILLSMKSRSSQNDQVVLLISSTLGLYRLLTVWPSVTITSDVDPDEECPPDTKASYFARWLWARVEPDPIPEWMRLAGLPDAPHIRRAIAVAIDNLMVFPDGSVSEYVKDYMTKQVDYALGRNKD